MSSAIINVEYYNSTLENLNLSRLGFFLSSGVGRRVGESARGQCLQNYWLMVNAKSEYMLHF